MAGALRHFMVVLLAAAQVVLGSSATGAVCLGAWRSGDGSGRDAAGDLSAGADPAGWVVEAGCSHAADGAAGPAPVQPHGEHEDECPCIDVGAPVGRAYDGRGGWDVVRGWAATALMPAPAWASGCVVAARQAVSRAARPPGPEPGLRTTRLLI